MSLCMAVCHGHGLEAMKIHETRTKLVVPWLAFAKMPAERSPKAVTLGCVFDVKLCQTDMEKTRLSFLAFL